MNRILFVLFIILGVSLHLFCQETLYTGLVVNAESGETLIFVSISKNQTHEGTTTDLDGQFSIKATIGDTLFISYVGFAKKQLILGNQRSLRIELQPKVATLEEIVVRPKENPAWRIIRETLAQRKQNDPQNHEGYTYNAYHKTVFAMDSLSSKETWQPIKEPKKERHKKALDRAEKIRDLFSNDLHLWVTESFTKNYFRQASKNKQEIVAYESSMPNDITGGLNPIDFQPFGFYNELIRIEFTNQNYVNPISKGTFQHYDFTLEDTLFHSIDTTFVISFEPQKGKHFVALKGLLYINTHGYAIEHVIAAPADKNQTLRFEIQQQSCLINERWFPQQMNTDLFIEMRFQDRFIEYAFRNRSLIDKVDFEVPEQKVFNHFLRENLQSQSSFPDSLRPLPLNYQESNTYTHWDSLPELRSPYRLLKTYNGLVKILATGLIETKVADIVISDVIQSNEHEGLRLGLGLQTSPHLLKHHVFYGYTAYGIKDKQWKYGGAWDMKVQPHRDLVFRVSHQKDLSQPGGLSFLSAINRPWSNFNSRNFFLSRFDDIEQYKLDLFHRPHPAWQWNIFVEQENRKPLYEYMFYKVDGQVLRDFEVQQTGLKVRWSPKEKRVKMDQLEAILNPSFPIANLALNYGHIGGIDLYFWKIAGRLEHEIRTKYLGATSVTLEGGYLSKSLPYSYLFQVLGNSSNGIASKSSFNTAGLTEFTNQQYAYAFITHDFGHLLGKSNKTPWFRPELSLTQNIGWGKNVASDWQHSFPVQDFSKIYLESGVGLRNILRFSYFKTVYIGVGGAAFYRWGAYQLPKATDNLFLRLLVSFSV